MEKFFLTIKPEIFSFSEALEIWLFPRQIFPSLLTIKPEIFSFSEALEKTEGFSAVSLGKL